MAITTLSLRRSNMFFFCSTPNPLLCFIDCYPQKKFTKLRGAKYMDTMTASDGTVPPTTNPATQTEVEILEEQVAGLSEAVSHILQDEKSQHAPAALKAYVCSLDGPGPEKLGVQGTYKSFPLKSGSWCFSSRTSFQSGAEWAEDVHPFSDRRWIKHCANCPGGYRVQFNKSDFNTWMTGSWINTAFWEVCF